MPKVRRSPGRGIKARGAMVSVYFIKTTVWERIDGGGGRGVQDESREPFPVMRASHDGSLSPIRDR